MARCTSLTHVELGSFGNPISMVGFDFMGGCTSLTTIDLSSMTRITAVGDGFMCECSALSSINMSSGAFGNVTIIGGAIFTRLLISR